MNYQKISGVMALVVLFFHFFFIAAFDFFIWIFYIGRHFLDGGPDNPRPEVSYPLAFGAFILMAAIYVCPFYLYKKGQYGKMYLSTLVIFLGYILAFTMYIR